jgi:hypothetical protein
MFFLAIVSFLLCFESANPILMEDGTVVTYVFVASNSYTTSVDSTCLFAPALDQRTRTILVSVKRVHKNLPELEPKTGNREDRLWLKAVLQEE